MSDVQHNSVEALWKQRWDEAKRKLELAAIHVRAVEKEIAAGGESRSREDYRHALEAEVQAAADYTRILRIYTDLMVYGKSPEESRESHG